jgi:hypothetical protein
MFVSGSQTYARFRAAVAARRLEEAMSAAKALPGLLSLVDALDLTLLAAESPGSERVFEGCAARWLARVAVERSLTLRQMLDAGAVLQAAGRGEEGNVHSSLAGYL